MNDVQSIRVEMLPIGWEYPVDCRDQVCSQRHVGVPGLGSFLHLDRYYVTKIDETEISYKIHAVMLKSTLISVMTTCPDCGEVYMRNGFKIDFLSDAKQILKIGSDEKSNLKDADESADASGV